MSEVEIPPVELIPIDELKVDGDNPNRMTESTRQALIRSIRRWGFIAPIITNRDLLIADGEQRLIAAQELGMKELPVIRLPVKDVDRRLLRQVLNKLRGRHDVTADAYEFIKIIKAGERETLQSLLELSNARLQRYLLRIQKPQGDTYQFRPLEAYKTDIQRGDLFSLGRHRLLCGDSTSPADVDRLMAGSKADMAFLDPPYNVDYSSKQEFLDKLSKSNRVTTPIIGDDIDDLYAFLRDVFQILLHHLAEYNAFYVTFAGATLRHLLNALADTGYKVAQILVWRKNRVVLGRADYRYQHELIVYGWHGKHRFYGKNERSVWDIDNPLRSPLHPTMKPVKLCQRAILNSSLPDQIVVDLFGGSGSTLIACEQLQRRCYMMELDPRYCQIIIDRWQAYTGMKPRQL